MISIFKLIFSKAGGISAIILAVIFCIFVVFQTGKKEARANGKRELAEYQLNIAKKEIKVLEKQYKTRDDEYIDLLKDYDKLNKENNEVKNELAKAIKEYEYAVRHDKLKRNAMLKIKKKYNLNKEKENE